MNSKLIFIIIIQALVLTTCDDCIGSKSDRTFPKYQEYVSFKQLEKCNDALLDQCGNMIYLVNKGSYTFRIKYKEINLTGGSSNEFVDIITIRGNDSIPFKCNRICPPSAPSTTTNYSIIEGSYMN